MQWHYAAIYVWAIALSVFDLNRRRLPNGLTLGGAGCAIAYILVQGQSPLGAAPSSALLAGFGAIVVSLPFYGLGWLGAGDAKLMAAIGFIGGAEVLLATFVLSSLLTLPYVFWRVVRARRREENVRSAVGRIPQGVFLAAGLLLVMAGVSRTGLG
ncbi:prepilin peptidase [Methylocaldum sp. MU1018]